MIKRVSRLEELGEIIREREPTEVLYDLGKGEERTELLVTHINEKSSITNRIASSPLIKLYGDNGEILMDITDSNRNTDGYSYRGLRPRGAVFEPPAHPPDELGDLVIDLDKGEKLAISQYARVE